MAISNQQIHESILGIRELLETKISHLEEKVDNTADKVDKLDGIIRGTNGRGVTTRLATLEKTITMLEWATGLVVTVVVGYLLTQFFNLL